MISRVARSLCVIAGAVPLVAGCYAYVPVQTAAPPPVGTRVAFDVTDQGRAALSDRLGVGVLRVEGTLTGSEADQYLMRVWAVGQIGGETTRWSGESVRIQRSFVGNLLERRLSRGKTYLAVAAALAAVAWFAHSQNLLGSANDNPDAPPVPPGPTRRSPWAPSGFGSEGWGVGFW